MGSDMQNFLMVMLMVLGGITVFVLLMVFVAVPVFKGIGAVIGATFKGIGWFFTHIFEFIIGTVSDVIRFVGSLLAMIVLVPLVPLNIIIGRWSAAGHFAEGVKRECHVGAACVYRAALRRPLKLVLLHGLLEGLEQRVPEAMHGAPGGDSPSRRTGQFDGYTILGSLRAGGSGAKLYIAQPDKDKRSKFRNLPDRVVIKSFALTEGSSLPQIVRESRALECAKQLGHVLDHGMDEHRFFYVMPYHPGDHLGILTRQMHGECGSGGLDQKRLNMVMSYSHDLLATLSAYHKGGLWHKDVKPENVIVHDGQAHLVDLGLVTPLRSAMTLTTHGTEYFRDPEMVRQALRGVKVHQVDGAKFDIYAVGAVLYFMMENTFPAHGGLSRFVNNSPESLRWIVRRAMTEYNQRYATAAEMLADLDFVASARDAFVVKPMDLPSMRGGSIPDVEQADVMASARTPAVEGFGLAAGLGTAGPFIQAGHFKVDDQGNPLPREDVGSGSKPKLTVTNWWTGAYRDESGVAQPAQGVGHDARDFRKQAYAFRQQAQEISRQARQGAMSARKAAREQIKAARQRARELRARAVSHRRTVVPHARTSRPAVIIGTLSVLFLTSILVFSFFGLSSYRSAGNSRYGSVSAVTHPVLLVVDAPNPSDPRFQSLLKGAIAKQRKQGYEVIIDQPSEQSHLLQYVREWMTDQNGPSDTSIEEALATRNAYGIMYVKAVHDKRQRVHKVNDLIIRSTRPGAKSRQPSLVVQVPAAPSLPYLLINDHPAKADPVIEKLIESKIKAYRDKGWLLMMNDELEIQVRKALPTGPIDQNTPMPPMIYTTLANAKFGGILRIDALPGNAPPQERIGITVLEMENLPTPTDLETPEEMDETEPITVEQGQAVSVGLVGAGSR